CASDRVPRRARRIFTRSSGTNSVASDVASATGASLWSARWIPDRRVEKSSKPAKPDVSTRGSTRTFLRGSVHQASVRRKDPLTLQRGTIGCQARHLSGMPIPLRWPRDQQLDGGFTPRKSLKIRQFG